MDTDFILQQVQHMKPSSLSVTEQQCYRAEKMLMRQFMLMKLQYQVPIYLNATDMKHWLLDGRSFLDEFQEIAKGAEPRKLLVAELAWTSARHLCLNQMEKELWEELGKERRLSLLLRQQVTLEGLQMFLSIIRPKAEQDVGTSLHHLSNKLLSSFVASHTGKRFRRALLIKLQQTTAPLAPQVVETALQFLLGEPEPLVELGTHETQGAVGSRDSYLTPALMCRADAASALTGKQLADAAATCFCLNTSFTYARLLRICTSAARDMVEAIYRRFVKRSKTFYLTDFDESSITARRSVIFAIQDMDERVRRAACKWASHQLGPKPNKNGSGGELCDGCRKQPLKQW